MAKKRINKWNITAPLPYINKIKTSKYFKQDLGKSHMVYDEKKGDRYLREGDFTTWYYNSYRSLAVKSGQIGPLHFYIDYHLREEIMGFFLDTDLTKHQYAIEWEQDLVDKLGIDIWLSEKLKYIDETLANEIENENNKDQEEEVGDANKLLNNPGGVSWKDIEAHFNKKKTIK